jgi:hypothetical protein
MVLQLQLPPVDSIRGLPLEPILVAKLVGWDGCLLQAVFFEA